MLHCKLIFYSVLPLLLHTYTLYHATYRIAILIILQYSLLTYTSVYNIYVYISLIIYVWYKLVW